MPRIIQERKLRYIAFYHSGAFDNEKHSIRYLAEVESISVAKRKDLLPEPQEESQKALYRKKANDEYYKISFAPLQPLAHPIRSLRWRRIVFLETTKQKLDAAREINDLFHGNNTEERFWYELIKRNIPAERQFYLPIKTSKFFLDFAVFCERGKINIECDGGYHNEQPWIDMDKNRNNLLQSKGWSVLRFSPEDVYNHTEATLAIVKDTIVQYGGAAVLASAILR